ncbi:MAG: hypothetical protein MUP85_04810 [Candidatus Lokiarchaeota archaeon]|nr:hypothetical protein [Candidatus Lokiarchaeota archaeon]
MNKVFDFDKEAQEVLNSFLFGITKTDWKSWLKLSTKEEYEEYLLKNSGFSSFSEILEKENLDSKTFSIDINSFIQNYSSPDPIILCHTSGTTNSNINALKWFHMSKDIVSRYWAPGMQAIFESSGLNSEKSAVIFVPSRTKLDGIKYLDSKQYLSLYSSEFSQRTMLSIIKPHSYLLHEYKKSKDLDIISKILSLEDIAVISAPAITILGWADIEKFQKGLSNSIAKDKEKFNYTESNLINLIKREGLKKASKIIQKKLSDKFSDATIIFSTSSLSESDWMLIRKFMRWKKGEEKFTNLYVASEVGPIASSLGDFDVSRANSMYLFPLTLDVLEYKGKKELVSRTENSIGKLLVSRFNNEEILSNIDLGDIIKIKSPHGLPIIDGTILRAMFELKYPLLISNKIPLSNHYTTHAGDYFIFDHFEIYNPRNLLNCLNSHCSSNFECLLLTKTNDSTFKLILPKEINSNCRDLDFVKKTIFNCAHLNSLKAAISNDQLKIELINDTPIDFLAARSEMLTNVRNGIMPKGILKKWPLYYIEIN